MKYSFDFVRSLRWRLLASISGAAFLAGCSSTQISTANAAMQSDAKAACPGLVAAAPLVNGVAVAVGSANGVGGVVVPVTTIADGVLNADCAAIEAQGAVK